MTVMTGARWLPWAAALVMVACREPTRPTEVLDGMFVLQSLDGKPLPVLQLDSPATQQYLEADTLIFDGDGTYDELTVTRTDSVGSTSSLLDETRDIGAYTVRGDSIDFVLSCPPNAACVAAPIGWRSADGSISVARRMGASFANVKRYEQVK